MSVVFLFTFREIAMRMKNNLNTEVVLQQIRYLLKTSCRETASKRDRYESLHLAILKKHFKAADVRIDHVRQIIHLSMTVEDTQEFLGMKSYVDVEMKYTNMYSFLESCLDKDDQNIVFYRNILRFYNQRALK